ncbi:type III secretion protein J [Luteimonas cucumeris]|uniref:Lipoprotein n=1 Tax=Luteimonas cucumeris TaxID=985012 RepID=A0A562KVK8_9GAMM|nr:type III secretion inner membrane ring lipoprotein SctJ [Luteimonas cucumeris]TWH99404.1 type III secretion protein J [Luteimonas cucumeris]
MNRPTGFKSLRLAALAAIAGLLLAGCNGSALYSDLDEQQANEVTAALQGAGIGAEKAPSPNKKGWEVRVGRNEFPQAMQVLHDRGLPRARYASMCEVFKKEGFASSAIEERARYQCSLEQEIARTLSQIPGVVDARVHIALPERDPLGGTEKVSSASVMIFERPGADLRDTETAIKVTVKDGVQGLDDVNKVTVKFISMSPPAGVDVKPRSTGITPALSSMSPLAIGIAVGAALLIALLVALLGRLRNRDAAATAQPQRGVWNG